MTIIITRYYYCISKNDYPRLASNKANLCSYDWLCLWKKDGREWRSTFYLEKEVLGPLVIFPSQFTKMLHKAYWLGGSRPHSPGWLPPPASFPFTLPCSDRNRTLPPQPSPQELRSGFVPCEIFSSMFCLCSAVMGDIQTETIWTGTPAPEKCIKNNYLSYVYPVQWNDLLTWSPASD